jgi:hypothetical protein
MSTNFRSNQLTKMLDKFFDDKCLYAKSGSVQRGPGFLCGFYIFLIFTSLIYNIVMSQEYLTKYGLSREQVVLQNMIDIVISLLSIVFIYHMCYICRGFLGFVLLIVFNISIQFIRRILFKTYNTASIKMYMNKLK